MSMPHTYVESDDALSSGNVSEEDDSDNPPDSYSDDDVPSLVDAEFPQS